MIPYGRQEVTDGDIAAVVEVLGSDFLTQGPVIPAFESAVAAYCRVSYAVAVSNATSALHLACLALGVGKGDWVWTSPISFVASANCALYCGANVDFVDIDPITCNMSTEHLARKLAEARVNRKLPKVVIPVHLSGQPCDMEAINILSKEYGFKIIEDASHAIGAHYQGEPVGNCHFSDITVFSFHPVKIVTTGEGGMTLTNNRLLAENMALLRSHGITRDPSIMTHIPDGPWYYQQIALGYNYRMTDIQAALGISQFKRLDKYIERRNQLADRYDTLMSNLPLTLPHRNNITRCSFHLYVIRLNNEISEDIHLRTFQKLRDRGVGVNLHYIPIHTQPYYAQLGFKAGMFPVAERYYKSAMTLPLYPALQDWEQDEVVAHFRSILLEH